MAVVLTATLATLATLAALLVSLGALIAYDLRGYHRALANDVATQAELLGRMTSAALTFGDQRLAAENLALLRIRPGLRAGAIYRANGALFASYVAAGEAPSLPAAPGAAGMQVNGNALLLFKPVVENGELLGTVYLRAEYTLLARALDYLLIGLIVTALALLIGYLLTRRRGAFLPEPISSILEMAKAHQPHLILMDINLSGMNGVDALHELRRDPSTSHIAVLALTANAMPRDIEKGIEAGFYRYLTKPINIDEFNDAIDSTLAMIDGRRSEPKTGRP